MLNWGELLCEEAHGPGSAVAGAATAAAAAAAAAADALRHEGDQYYPLFRIIYAFDDICAEETGIRGPKFISPHLKSQYSSLYILRVCAHIIGSTWQPFSKGSQRRIYIHLAPVKGGIFDKTVSSKNIALLTNWSYFNIC